MREPARRSLAIALLLLSALPLLTGQDRVPRPQLPAGYRAPELTTPPPREQALEYLDVAVLALALGLSAWLAIRGRSRPGIFLLGVFSIGYFGFFRRGCVCPIGAIQNIALSLADTRYALPLTVVAFFALPLVVALLTGRTFCGAVCPFGALQDAVIVRPLRLPRWLTSALGVIPALYLGLAVLLAATGADFVICRFDPFVSFFRLSGGVEVLALGASFLALGTVVARPYCRFVCPYGLILGWLSRLSVRHATISPDRCVQCRLCDDACPVDAIRAASPAPRVPAGERRALAASLLALPLLVALGAFAGARLAPLLSRAHPTVRLDLQIRLEDADPSTIRTLQSEAFRTTGATTAELRLEADAARRAFDVGAPLLGAFVMLVLTLSQIASYIARPRSRHEPDRGECVSCGRCFAYCPHEHLRLRGGAP